LVAGRNKLQSPFRQKGPTERALEVTEAKQNLQTINGRIQQRRAALLSMRTRVREHRLAGEGGIACCEWLSDQVDEFIREIVAQQQEMRPQVSPESFAVLAVGGNGRRRPAPFSDMDLLFLMDAKHQTTAQGFLSAVVRDCWDAGAQLGSSLRTISDVVRFAGDDIQFATSLIETRVLCGNERLAETALQQVRSRSLSRIEQNQ
jgi:[protein-PII] uridylyltransferase